MHLPIFLQHPINLLSLSFPYYMCGFFLFAFIGWCGECLYARLVQGHWVNRGFLNGPLCPIYGVGAMSVSLMLSPFRLDSFGLFLVGGLLCTVLELITGAAMESIWHLRWWDYSKSKFNFKGYICLSASLAWGVLSVVLIHLIDPFIFYYMEKIPKNIVSIIAIVLSCILFVDLIVTVVSSSKLSNNIKKVSGLKDQLREKYVDPLQEKYVDPLQEKYSEHMEKIMSTTTTVQKRLLRAFPTMESTHFSQGLDMVREKFSKITTILSNDSEEIKEDIKEKIKKEEHSKEQ